MPCSKSLRCGVIIIFIESLRPGAAPRIEKWNHVCDLVWLGCPSQSVRAHTTKSFSPHCSTRPRFPESKSALQMRPPTLRSAVRSAVGKLLAARAADAVAGSSKGMQVATGRATLRAESTKRGGTPSHHRPLRPPRVVVVSFCRHLEGSTFIVLSRNRETYRERAFFSTAGQRSTTDYGAHVGHEHTNVHQSMHLSSVHYTLP